MPFDPFFSSKPKQHEPAEIVAEVKRLENLPYDDRRRMYQECWNKIQAKEFIPRALYLFWCNYRRRKDIRSRGDDHYDKLAKKYLGGNVLSGYNAIDNQSRGYQVRPYKQNTKYK